MPKSVSQPRSPNPSLSLDLRIRHSAPIPKSVSQPESLNPAPGLDPQICHSANPSHSLDARIHHPASIPEPVIPARSPTSTTAFIRPITMDGRSRVCEKSPARPGWPDPRQHSLGPSPWTGGPGCAKKKSVGPSLSCWSAGPLPPSSMLLASGVFLGVRKKIRSCMALGLGNARQH